MKIGVFGGAFNPVHNGHLHLSKCYIDALNLDKILLIPTALPPHKSSNGLVSGEHRINMLRLAIENDDRFEICDIEFKLEGKSYTYNTLVELNRLYPNDELFLIVGSDQFLSFNSWYRADDILNMVTVVTASREMDEYKTLVNFKQSQPNMKNTIVSSFDAVVVSSSDIRERLISGGSINDLVPASVEKYIKDNGLYV